MAGEYLLFNALVLAGPVIARICWPSRLRFPQTKPMLISIALVAAFFILIDVLVTDTFWSFNPLYVLGTYFLSIPFEEVLFFLTVPFACLFVWVNLKIPQFRLPQRRGWFTAFILLALVGLALSVISGWWYSVLALGLLLFASLLTHSLVPGILKPDRILVFVGIVMLLTLACNWYLTARPVVLYNPEVKSNLMILTIPLEDFLFGISLLLLNISVYEYAKKRLNTT